MTCRICGNDDTITLDRRGPIPIAQNLILPTRNQAVNCPAGWLDMRRCTACGFVWNEAFDPGLMVYDAAYDNDQSFSPRFVAHVEAVATRALERVGEAAMVNLLEVGCGQGSFMATMGRSLGARLASALGFDPAWKGGHERLPPRSAIRGEYFSAGSMRPDDPAPTLVVSRHTIEHVPDPLAFLHAIRAGISEGTVVVIETPDVDWILRNGVFFDFYYEHCSLFPQSTLAFALGHAGFVVEQIGPVFDDQYQLAIAVAGPVSDATLVSSAGRFDDLGFLNKRGAFLADLGRGIERLGPPGSVALWGGASKGVTICQTLPDAELRLPCVIDINDRKQGCFLPTSGIPIVSPEEAAARGITAAVVVNSNYTAEVRALLEGRGIAIDAVSIDDLRG